MATYKQIQKYVKNKYGKTVKSCWIAHVKEMSGLHPRVSSRRYDPKVRQVPCPPEKIKLIQEAMQYLAMI